MDRYLLRLNGLHAINIYPNGEVIYSVGRKKLFTLTKSALKEVESMVCHCMKDVDSIKSNVIRINQDNKMIPIYNNELYVDIIRMLFKNKNIVESIDDSLEGTLSDFEYTLIYGDLTSEVPLEVLDREYVEYLGEIDFYYDVILNLLTTKDLNLYYDKKLYFAT